MFFAYILPHVLILSEDRFHLALIPYFAILAARAIILMREGKFKGMLRPGAFILASVLIFLLALNLGLELYRDADKIAQLLSPTGSQSHFPY